MIRPGLVSVTFRQLNPSEIVSLACQVGLQGIEWGGDLHVPPGDHHVAQEVQSLMGETGLETISYGSYYRVGTPKANEFDFKAVLETALILGAPAIRVWAGVKGSDQTDPATYQKLVNDLQRIADLSVRHGLAINVEFHRGTYCDSAKTALKLKKSVDRPNVFLYWQPDQQLPHADRLRGLYQMAPYVSNLHVFQWDVQEGVVVRHPLSDGEEEWMHYLDIFDEPTYDRYALLEFVRGDSTAQFVHDAEVLKKWLKPSQKLR